MKKFEHLGRSLSKEEQKKIMGGLNAPIDGYGNCNSSCSGNCTTDCRGSNVTGKCSNAVGGNCYCFALC